MDHLGHEIAKDDLSSSAPRETCNEADDESTAAEIAAEAKMNNSKFQGVEDDGWSSNGRETRSDDGTEDDGSNSKNVETSINDGNEDDLDEFFDYDLDQSFDHVLDNLPSSSTMPLSKLCGCCQKLVDELGRLEWIEKARDCTEFEMRIPHVQDPLALLQSAKDGCALCALFLGVDYEKSRNADISRYIGTWKDRFGETTFPNAWAKLWCIGAEKDSPKYIDLIYTDHPQGQEYRFIARALISLQLKLRRSPKIYNMAVENLDRNSNTSQSLPLVKEWLNVCKRLHPKCINSQRQGFVPTRLIDVHGSNPRLRLSSSFKGDCVQYATLSHCWGSPEKEILKLTRSTLDNHLSEIKTGELPKTFRDAIEICKTLDIRYIWIDSLCIIQGDEEDWTKESATMANVYGGCLLNIAASSAKDSKQGCFFERKYLPRFHFSLKHLNNTNVEYDCIPVANHPLHNIDLCPLETRGWTLQERLLSPRTVHFTRDEVFWECHSKFVSETSPFRSNKELMWRKEPLSIKNWTNIINHYSRRHLTYEKDRLVALAGIAETIWYQTKDEYCAGIWCGNLRELCWYSYISHGRFLPKRAPTWSWASISVPFMTMGKSEVGRITVSKVLKLERPRSDNSFGDMPNAVLWLSCPPLLVAKLSQSQCLTMQNGFTINDYVRGSYASQIMDGIVDAETYVYILRLMNRGGLILRRTENSQDEYERIGAWRYRKREGSYRDKTNDLKRLYNDRTNHAEESAYVPRERHKFDNERHVITLV
ncbi:hypothetical protein OCU04_012249 [Sclerotinia nivalis]|uniref:Heterokaryon incompatibility domain-containing protein n=1 Tax=Sclerotinia nivalis TaxID=352851 RepID=A0A9X0DDZ9_9HELO|nr:hypothetical protein OCU04_012249 [Sclerotinia nivalis]